MRAATDTVLKHTEIFRTDDIERSHALQRFCDRQFLSYASSSLGTEIVKHLARPCPLQGRNAIVVLLARNSEPAKCRAIRQKRGSLVFH